MEKNVIQLLNVEQFRDTFNLDTEQYVKVVKAGIPHFCIEGTNLFDMADAFPWLKANYYVGGKSEPDTEG